MCVGLLSFNLRTNVFRSELNMTKPSFALVVIGKRDLEYNVLLAFLNAKGFLLGVDLGLRLICCNY